MNHNKRKKAKIEVGCRQSRTSSPLSRLFNHFPEIVVKHIVPYIRNRVIVNAVTSSSKKIHDIITADPKFMPSWPTDFRLRVPGYVSDELSCFVWSTDGTQLACYAGYYHEIQRVVIFHQRYGLLSFDRRGGGRRRRSCRIRSNNKNNNDTIGWVAHATKYTKPDLKYSPDGSFLVSACDDGSYRNNKFVVRIWDYNITADGHGYYEQKQEWNISQEIGQVRHGNDRIYIDVSPCSRYIVVLAGGRHVLLKDVRSSNDNTIQLMVLPETEIGSKIVFSNIKDSADHYSIFIVSTIRDDAGILFTDAIKIWCPDATIDTLTTLWEQSNFLMNKRLDDFTLSRDNSLIAVHIRQHDSYWKTLIYSIDTIDKATSKIKFNYLQSFTSFCSPIQFTPDNKGIAYLSEEGKFLFFDIPNNEEHYFSNYILPTDGRGSKKCPGITFPPFNNGRSNQRVLVRASVNERYTDYHIVSLVGN